MGKKTKIFKTFIKEKKLLKLKQKSSTIKIIFFHLIIQIFFDKEKDE